jgi:enamine deaminase RidA (YjgF/YER057c/UK114 family)
MGEQMRQTYVNAEKLLRRFGASLDDVVEEVIYVLDVDAAFKVAGPVRKAAYGRQDPQVASTLVGTTRLAFPEQLVEIKLVARI